jgi:hypothetical protein
MAEQAKERAEKAQEQAEKAQERAETTKKQGIVDRIHLCQKLLKTTLTAEEELLASSLEELEARAKALQEKLGVV